MSLGDIKNLRDFEETLAKSYTDINLKFFLCVLEKLLDQECNNNGGTFLISLLMDEKFLRAVSGLCLEVLPSSNL